MREPNNLENVETWDDGTYQTGATQPGKNQSGLIAGLLMAVIFLGGMASALGLMNVRLLSQLVQQENPVLPVAVDANTTGGDLFREGPENTPKVPQNAQLQLQVAAEPGQRIDAAAVTARLTVEDNRNQEKNGTALILSSDGFLLTTAHLTDSALSITAQLPDGRTVPAALVACDPYSDLAVVYVGVQGLVPAVFSDAPTGVPGTYKMSDDGVVAFLEDGRVAGMLVSDMDGRTKRMNDGSMLLDIATQLVEKGCVSGRPGIGLQVRAMSHFCREYWDLEHGVEIVESQVDGLFAGDILLGINGQRLIACHQLHQLLMDAQPGQQVRLEIFRAGVVFTITLPVMTNP